MIEKEEGVWVRFHMWIDDGLWDELEVMDYRGRMGVLGKAQEILSLFYNKNRKFITRIRNERSRDYPVPNPHDIHLRIPLKTYRWLKDSHAGQNVNGMAQIVRAILRYYVELVKKFGIKRAMDIFTGVSSYPVMRAFVHLGRLHFADFYSSRIKTQLYDIPTLAYDFIIKFVVLME